MGQQTRGAAYDFLARKFGGVVTEKITTVLAQNPSTLLEGDTERVFALFVNTHATNNVQLFFGPLPAVGHGIKLSANGGLFAVDVDNDAILPTMQWQVVGGGAETIWIIALRRDMLQEPPGA